MSRTGCLSDAGDEDRAFAAPYLKLMKEDAPQRSHDLREVFNGLRWLVRAGAQWRMMLNDFPPWPAVCQQARRRVAAGVFESMAHDLRAVLRQEGCTEEDIRATLLAAVRSKPQGHRMEERLLEQEGGCHGRMSRIGG